MTALYDAHNHLHDARLTPFLEPIIDQLAAAGVARCVVNGTSEADWPQVADLARRYPELVIPSFGLHPWMLAERSPDWLEILTGYLDSFALAGLGECGLDRWIKDYDLEAQREVFLAQLALATERNLPLSIHCLKAWGPLLECLRAHPRPERGFLLHGFGGSRELVAELTPLGARFSFCGYFLRDGKERVREAFRAVPPERVLAETDAPDMLPPAASCLHPLESAEGEPLNHPANLPAVVGGLAALLECREEDLRHTLAHNFQLFFAP